MLCKNYLELKVYSQCNNLQQFKFFFIWFYFYLRESSDVQRMEAMFFFRFVLKINFSYQYITPFFSELFLLVIHDFCLEMLNLLFTKIHSFPKLKPFFPCKNILNYLNFSGNFGHKLGNQKPTSISPLQKFGGLN